MRSIGISNRTPIWRTYFTKDAMHYHVAAEAFASGDFSMSYEKGWPYRQPLFPLLIAGVMKATNHNLFAIRMINVGVIVFAGITLFVILRAFWRDSATAAIISILFVLNPFFYDQSVHGLNTEPSDPPTRRPADTPTRRHADTPTRRHADTPTRRHADTLGRGEYRVSFAVLFAHDFGIKQSLRTLEPAKCIRL